MTVHILGVGLNAAFQAFWMHCVDRDTVDWADGIPFDAAAVR